VGAIGVAVAPGIPAAVSRGGAGAGMGGATSAIVAPLGADIAGAFIPACIQPLSATVAETDSKIPKPGNRTDIAEETRF